MDKTAVILAIWAAGLLAALGVMTWMLVDGYPQGLAMIFVIVIGSWVAGQCLERVLP